MTLDKLKDAIIGNGNNVYFALDGLKCGIEPEVHSSVFTFEIWYGHQVKAHSDFDMMIHDKFFGGKSISDIIDKVEFDFL